LLTLAAADPAAGTSPCCRTFKSMSSSRLRSDGATGALPPIQMLFL
jgi:hypothetical protein